jgi:hypothetical protein
MKKQFLPFSYLKPLQSPDLTHNKNSCSAITIITLFILATIGLSELFIPVFILALINPSHLFILVFFYYSCMDWSFTVICHSSVYPGEDWSFTVVHSSVCSGQTYSFSTVNFLINSCKDWAFTALHQMIILGRSQGYQIK